MATNTAGSTARVFQEQEVHYVRFDVTYSDAGIATGVSKQTLPAGAIIIGTDVLVATAFNAQTTNVLTVGTNGTTATAAPIGITARKNFSFTSILRTM